MLKNTTSKSALILLTVFLLSGTTFAQKKLGFFQRIKIKKQLNEGKIMVYENDYRGALSLFRKVLSVDSSNATANFRVAQCHYNLGKPRLGVKYAYRALSLDSTVSDEVYFVLAESQHRLGKLEDAKKNYRLFKSMSSKSTIADYEVDKLIAQCDYAKMMMNTPVEVTIDNMGRMINTYNPEYAASISSDGKTLVFTSRRADSEGGEVDEQSDRMYFEDIYISLWNDTTKEWSESKPVEGNVNSVTHDAVLSISPDGKSLYVYKNELGETKSGDIYVARKGKENKFGTARTVDEGRNINSSYFESSASITEDGKTMYFVSDRNGGKGQADIYKSSMEGDKWGKAINLGDSVNTSGDEACVYIHPSGNYMFFTSTGHTSLGSYDIFVSKKVDGKWSKAKNIGYPINTVGDEKTISVTADLKTAYISATRKGGKGGSDIYVVDLSKLDFLHQ